MKDCEWSVKSEDADRRTNYILEFACYIHGTDLMRGFSAAKPADKSGTTRGELFASREA